MKLCYLNSINILTNMKCKKCATHWRLTQFMALQNKVLEFFGVVCFVFFSKYISENVLMLENNPR